MCWINGPRWGALQAETIIYLVQLRELYLNGHQNSWSDIQLNYYKITYQEATTDPYINSNSYILNIAELIDSSLSETENIEANTYFDPVWWVLVENSTNVTIEDSLVSTPIIYTSTENNAIFLCKDCIDL